MSAHREKWPEMRMKHLELVQNAITRMGANSTALKGYCMAIVAAVVGLAGAIEKPRILLLAVPIVFVLSVLDASYLRLERGFIRQYNSLRVMGLDRDPDFEIEPDLSSGIFKTYFSWSVIGFYSAAAAILVSVGELM
jgi:hypothetical protein